MRRGGGDRRIDTAYEIYLGLYQAITGPEESRKIHRELSPGFFDLIVIDECHRGSAADDSAWREILEYFSAATQIGLTATPKETQYVSNIAYFGEPVFSYSLKQGISDGFLMRERYVKRPEDEAAMQASLRAVEKKPLPHMLAVTNMPLHNVEAPSFLRHDNTLARPYTSWGKSERVDIVLTNPPFGGKEEDGIESNFPQRFRTRETADLFLALIIRLLKAGGRAAVALPDGSLFGEDVKARLKESLMQECNLHTIVRLPNSVFKPYASIGTNLLFFEKGEPTREVWFWEHRVPDGQKHYSKTRPIRLEHMADCAAWWGGAERAGREEGERAWKVSASAVRKRGYNLDIKNPHTEAEYVGNPEKLLAQLNRAEAEVRAVRDQLKNALAEALLR